MKVNIKILFIIASLLFMVAAGCSGKTGTQGPAGTNGINGTNGTQGPQGPQGAQGITGPTMPVIESLSVSGLPAEPGAKVTATVMAQSAQHLALTYTWTVSNGWVVTSGGSSPTAVITAPNTYGANGTATVTVSDTKGMYAIGSISLNTEGNTSPTINSITAYPNPVDKGGIITISIVAQDSDKDILSYSWSVPSGWTIQSGQGASQISVLSPSQYDTGGNVNVTISDGNGGVVMGSIYVGTVDNSYPVINSMSAAPSLLSPQGNAVAIVSAYDQDGDTLSYIWTASPGWSVAGYGQTASVTAPALYNAVGYITVTVSDNNGGIITATTALSTETNSIPIMSTIVASPNPVNKNGTLTISASAIDPDGDSLTYNWIAPTGWTIQSGQGTSQVSVLAPDQYSDNGVFTLTVSDGFGGIASGSINVSTNANAYPVINSIVAVPNTVNIGGTSTVSVSAVDPDGDTLTYAWTVPSGWTIQSGQGTSQISVTAPAQYANGGTINVNVSDGYGGIANGSVYIRTISNSYPVINSISVYPAPANIGGTITVSTTAMDQDGDALTYAWTVSNGWTISSGGNTPTATITAPNTYGAIGTATVTVTDAQGGYAVGVAVISTITETLAQMNPVINQLSVWGLPALPGAQVQGTVTAFSPKGLALTYNWTVTPGWTILGGGNSSVATIQAPNTYGASGTATITVTDSQGGSTIWQYPLSTITGGPIINGTNTTGIPANPNGGVIATVDAYSPMGLGLTYTWTVSSGWIISSGGNTSICNITAPATYGATGTATITVTDTNGLSTVDTVSLSTLSGDPVIYGINIYYPPNQLNGGYLPTATTFTAEVSAYSPKGLGLNYTWTSSGGWTITGGTNSSVVYVTSPDTYSTVGVLNVEVTDTQGGLVSDQANVQTIYPPPVPVIQSLTAWGLPVSPGTNVIVNVVVQSTPGLNLTYSWTVSSGWTISTGGNSSVVTITSPGAYDKTGTATVTVTDSLGRQVSGSIPISTISTTPVINYITIWGSMPITPSTSFTATVSATSPAGYTLYYTWTTSTNWTITTGGSSNQVTITSPGAYSMTGTATVIVYDLYGGSATATIPLVTAQQTLPMNTFTTGTYPEGIAIDATGNIWVANNGDGTVTELNSTGTIVGTFTVGTGPVGIAIDTSGNVWVANSGGGGITGGTGNITELDSFGNLVGTYPVYTAGASPHGIAIDKNGNIWIANSGSNSVTELNSSGYPVGTYSLGSSSYCFMGDGYGIAIDISGNAWVTTCSNGVVELSPSGNIIGTYSAGGNPQGIAIDGSGNVWVTNFYGSIVNELNSSGTTIGTYTVGGSYLSGIAIDASGNVWVAGNFGGALGVTELSPTGVPIGTYTTGYWSWNVFPGIAIDASGNIWETIPSQIWNGSTYVSYVAEFLSATTGPQFFPYTGPQFAGGGNW